MQYIITLYKIPFYGVKINLKKRCLDSLFIELYENRIKITWSLTVSENTS